MKPRKTDLAGVSESDIRLYAVDHTAKILSLGRNSVFGLIASGRLKAVKVGTRTLIPRASIDAFLAEIGAA